jgi:hypothetical protein
LERRAFYSGHPALHLSGQLTLFKFVPDEFVPSFWLSYMDVVNAVNAGAINCQKKKVA